MIATSTPTTDNAIASAGVPSEKRKGIHENKSKDFVSYRSFDKPETVLSFLSTGKFQDIFGRDLTIELN